MAPRKTRQSNKNTPKAKINTQNKTQNRCLSPQEGGSKQFFRQQNNQKSNGSRSAEAKEKQQNNLIQSNTENKNNMNEPSQQSIEARVLQMSAVEFHEYTNVVELIEKRFRKENYPEEKLQKLLSDIDVYVFRVYDKYQRKPKYRKDEFFKNLKIFDRKEQNKYIDHSKKRNRVELVMKDGKRRYIVKIPRPASSEKTAKPFNSQLSVDTDSFSGQICHGSTKRQRAQRIYDDNSEGPDCDDQNLNLAETTPDDLVTASQKLTQNSEKNKYIDHSKKRNRVELVIKDRKKRCIVEIPKLVSSEKTAMPFNSQLSDDTDSCIGRIVQRSTKRQREQRIYDDSSEEPDCDDQNINLAEATPEVLAPASRKPTQSSDLTPKETRQSKNTPKAKTKTQNKIQNRCISPQEGSSKQFIRQQNNPKTTSCISNTEPKEKQQNDLIQSNTENKDNMNMPLQQSIEDRVLKMSVVEFHEYTNVVELIEKRFREENYPEEKLQKLLLDIDVYVFRVYDKYQRKPKYRKDEFFKNLKIFDRKEQNKYIDHSKKRNRVELVMKDGKRRYIVKIPRPASSEKTAKPFNSQLSVDTDSFSGQICHGSTKTQRAQRIYDDNSEGPDCDDQNLNLAETAPDDLVTASQNLTQSSDEKSCNQEEKRGRRGTTSSKNKILKQKAMKRCPSPKEGCSKWLYNSPSRTSCQKSIQEYFQPSPTIVNNVVKEKPGPLSKKRKNCETNPERNLEPHESVEHAIDNNVVKEKPGPLSKKRKNCETNSERTLEPHECVEHAIDNNVVKEKPGPLSKKRNNCETNPERTLKSSECVEHVIVKNVVKEKPGPLLKTGKSCETSPKKTIEPHESVEHAIDNNVVNEKPGPLSKKRNNCETNPERTLKTPECVEHAIVKNVLKEKPGPLSKKEKSCETSSKKTIEPHESVEHAIDNNVVNEKPGPLSKKRNNCETNPERILKTPECVEHAIVKNVLKEKPGPLSKKEKSCETSSKKTIEPHESVEHAIDNNIVNDKPGPLSKKRNNCETNPERILEAPECAEPAIVKNVLKEKPGPLEKKGKSCETSPEKTIEPHEFVEHAIGNNVKEKPGSVSKKRQNCETNPGRSVEHVIANNIVKEKPGPLSKKRKYIASEIEADLDKNVASNSFSDISNAPMIASSLTKVQKKRVQSSDSDDDFITVREKKNKAKTTPPSKKAKIISESNEIIRRRHIVENTIPMKILESLAHLKRNENKLGSQVDAAKSLDKNGKALDIESTVKSSLLSSSCERNLVENATRKGGEDNGISKPANWRKGQASSINSIIEQQRNFMTIVHSLNECKEVARPSKRRLYSNQNNTLTDSFTAVNDREKPQGINNTETINNNNLVSYFSSKYGNRTQRLSRDTFEVRKTATDSDLNTSELENERLSGTRDSVKILIQHREIAANQAADDTNLGNELNPASASEKNKHQPCNMKSLPSDNQKSSAIYTPVPAEVDAEIDRLHRLSCSTTSSEESDSVETVIERLKPCIVHIKDNNVHIENETLRDGRVANVHPSPLKNRTIENTAITNEELNKAEGKCSSYRDNITCLSDDNPPILCPSHIPPTMSSQQVVEQNQEKSKTSQDSINIEDEKSGEQSKLIEARTKLEINENLDDTTHFDDSDVIYIESGSENVVIIDDSERDLIDSNVHIENETLRDDTRAKVHPSPPKNKTIKIRVITNEELNKAEGEYLSFRDDITCLDEDNPTILCASHIPPTMSSQQVVDQNQEKSKTSQQLSINIEDEKSGDKSKLVEARTKLEINENLDDTTHFDDSDVIYIESGSENVVNIEDSERDLIDSNVHIENETLRDDTRAKVHPSPPKNKTIKIRAITNEELKKAEGEYLSFRDDITCLGDDNPTILCASHIPPTISSQQAVEQNQEKSKTSQDSINIEDGKSGEQSKLIEARPKLEMNENLDDTTQFDDSDVIYIESGSENVLSIEDSEQDLIDEMQQFGNISYQSPSFSPVKPVDESHQHCIPFIESICLSNVETNCYPSGSSENSILPIKQETTADDPEAVGNKDADVLGIENCTFASEKDLERTKISESGRSENSNKSNNNEQNAAEKKKVEIKQELIEYSQYDDEIQFLPSKTVVVILDHGNNTEDLFHQMCNPNEVDFIEEPVAQSSEHRKDIPAENAQNENDSSSPAEHFPSPPIMSSASSNQSSLMNPAQIISSTMITSSAESIKLEEYQGQSGSSLSDTNIDSTVNAHRDSESSEQVRCEETNSHKDVPTLVRNATSTHIGNGTVQMLENPSNSIDTGVAPEIDVGVAPEIDVGVAPELALKNDIVSERNIQTQNARGRVRAVMKIIVEGRYRPLQLVKEKCEFGHSSSGSGDRPKNNAKAIESISSYEKEDERDYLIEDASQDIISPHSSFNPDAYLEGDTSMFGNLSIHSQPKSNGTKETTDTKLSSEHGKNSALPTIQKPHHEKLSAKSSPSTTLCRPVHSSQYTTLTYLDINTIEFWKNVNDLHYECGAPFLQHSNDIRAKATIKFRMGHCCIIEIMGNSLRLLLGLTIKEWTCVLKLISMIEKFKYNSSGERPKDQSLPDQILYHLFKTLPKFAQVTLECDPTMNDNQANCVSVSLGTEYLKHYKSLTRALDPKHLERLKRLKAKFHDFWE